MDFTGVIGSSVAECHFGQLVVTAVGHHRIDGIAWVRQPAVLETNMQKVKYGELLGEFKPSNTVHKRSERKEESNVQ